MNIIEERKKMELKYKRLINGTSLTENEKEHVKRMWRRLSESHIFDVGHLADFVRNTGKYANWGDGPELIIAIASEPGDFYYVTMKNDERGLPEIIYHSAVSHYDVINQDLMLFTNLEIKKEIDEIFKLYDYNHDTNHIILKRIAVK